MTAQRAIPPLVLLSLLVSSCEQPFDPRGTQPRRLVVFSILSTDRSKQFVRVEQDYMPVSYDPLTVTSDLSIHDATVLLKSGTGTIRLRDTTLARGDTTRYPFVIGGYVADPFTPEHGKSYQVSVHTADLGSSFGNVIVPSKPALSLELLSSYVLDAPVKAAPEADILFPLTLGANTRGYIARLYVDYDVLVNFEWISQRDEIPVSYAYAGLTDFRYVSYGTVAPRPQNGHTSAWYKNDLYRKALSAISDRYKSSRIIFNRVVLQVLQMDSNLYNYYFVAHAYNDPHSIRLDEPLFSNVTGGYGIVGAYTLDSLIHLLPENFEFSR